MALIQYNLFKNNLYFILYILLLMVTNKCECENLTTTNILTTVKLPVEEITTKSSISPVNFTYINSTQSVTEIIKSTPEPPQKPPPALGLLCNGTSQCQTNFSLCINGICSCQSNYIASEGNLRCLPVVTKLGDECSEDQQCASLIKDVGPTTCLNFKCSCAIGMSIVDNKCQGRRMLNSKCNSDEECPILKSFCTEEGECSCAVGFVPNSENDMCLPVNLLLQKLGAPSPTKGCSQDVQCQDGMGDLAICAVTDSGGKCECSPGSHIVKNMCIPFRDLGDSCSYDEECITKDQNSESEASRICNQNICKCNADWTQVGDICTGGGASANTLAAALMSIILTFWIIKGNLMQ